MAWAMLGVAVTCGSLYDPWKAHDCTRTGESQLSCDHPKREEQLERSKVSSQK